MSSEAVIRVTRFGLSIGSVELADGETSTVLPGRMIRSVSRQICSGERPTTNLELFARLEEPPAETVRPLEPRSARDPRIWVNDERTVLFRVYADGLAEVATRETPAHTWGPPVRMMEER